MPNSAWKQDRFSHARKRSTCGFTLIELLVVISIIVLLLSLLAPAMDRAIYMAEMTQDGAQMRGIGAAILAYATGSDRRYPDRGAGSSWDAMQIKSGAAFDVTRKLMDYVSAEAYLDPFLADANLDADACMEDPYGVFMPGYHLYTDWGNPAISVSRMKKIGQKMTFNSPEGEKRRFGILLADRDVRWIPGNAQSTTSHQDKDGVTALWSFQDGGNPWLTQNNGVPFLGAATGNVYVAWYFGVNRGTVDNNYAMDDGSILRLDNVPLVDNPAVDDDRITFLPDVADIAEYNNGRRVQLPRIR